MAKRPLKKDFVRSMKRQPPEKEMESRIPESTRLKLFVYPGKEGAISSYPTTYCVGFERHNGGFVSQTFLTPWVEDYKEALEQFGKWKQVIGADQLFQLR